MSITKLLSANRYSTLLLISLLWIGAVVPCRDLHAQHRSQRIRQRGASCDCQDCRRRGQNSVCQECLISSNGQVSAGASATRRSGQAPVVEQASFRRLLNHGTQCQNCRQWMCPDCGFGCGCPNPAPMGPSHPPGFVGPGGPQIVGSGGPQIIRPGGRQIIGPDGQAIPQTGMPQTGGTPGAQATPGAAGAADAGADPSGTASPGTDTSTAPAQSSLPGADGQFDSSGAAATAGAAGVDEGGGLAGSGYSSIPGMMGDNLAAIPGVQISVNNPIGPAVFHPAPEGINDIHLIRFLDANGNAEFINGPNGPGFFLAPGFTDVTPASVIQPLIDGTTGETGFAAAVTGQSASVAVNNGSPLTGVPVYNVTQPQTFFIPATPGDQVGRMKITENSSPIPRDRVFLNYSLFHNANNLGGVSALGGRLNVNRFTPGFEKTFFWGWTSVEMRFPFAGTLASDQNLNFAQAEDVEFGNIMAAFKTFLYRGESFAITGGMSVNLPTADDIRIFSAFNGQSVQLAEINNDAVHLLPFFGGVFQTGCLFAQGFFQLDIDPNGNKVETNQVSATTGQFDGLTRAGKIQSPNFLYLDFNIGYWLYDNPCGFVKAFAPMLEFHMTQSLQDTDVVQDPVITLGVPADNIYVTNMVVGGLAEVGNGATVSVGYGTPLGANADRQFDGELRVIFNQPFGRSRNYPPAF